MKQKRKRKPTKLSFNSLFRWKCQKAAWQRIQRKENRLLAFLYIYALCVNGLLTEFIVAGDHFIAFECIGCASNVAFNAFYIFPSHCPTKQIHVYEHNLFLSVRVEGVHFTPYRKNEKPVIYGNGIDKISLNAYNNTTHSN